MVIQLPRCLVKILNPIRFATSAFIQTLVTCATLFPLLYPCSTAAQSGEVYTVKNVKVDVTAESAAVAREAALKIGQKKAHKRLMKRIVQIRDFSNLPKLLDKQLVQLVAGVEVVEEKGCDGAQQSRHDEGGKTSTGHQGHKPEMPRCGGQLDDVE